MNVEEEVEIFQDQVDLIRSFCEIDLREATYDAKLEYITTSKGFFNTLFLLVINRKLQEDIVEVYTASGSHFQFHKKTQGRQFLTLFESLWSKHLKYGLEGGKNNLSCEERKKWLLYTL